MLLLTGQTGPFKSLLNAYTDKIQNLDRLVYSKFLILTDLRVNTFVYFSGNKSMLSSNEFAFLSKP